jgi:hypothetical protein
LLKIKSVMMSVTILTLKSQVRGNRFFLMFWRTKIVDLSFMILSLYLVSIFVLSSLSFFEMKIETHHFENTTNHPPQERE